MKRWFPLLVSALLLFSLAWADPLPLGADLSDSVTVLFEEDDPSAGQYVYAYTYPHVEDSAPEAALVNAFFDYLVKDAYDFVIPMGSEDYGEMGISVRKTISYIVTCNNEEYFSVLVESRDEFEDDFSSSWTGYSFSRTGGSPGSTATLPQLLHILATDENDTWLQERQTAKADALVRAMIWERIQDNPDDLPYHPEFTEEMLESCFYPEEDYYLDEHGDPVFYLEPGYAAPADLGLMTFPITIADILDEM